MTLPIRFLAMPRAGAREERSGKHRQPGHAGCTSRQELRQSDVPRQRAGCVCQMKHLHTTNMFGNVPARDAMFLVACKGPVGHVGKFAPSGPRLSSGGGEMARGPVRQGQTGPSLQGRPPGSAPTCLRRHSDAGYRTCAHAGNDPFKYMHQCDVPAIRPSLRGSRVGPAGWQPACKAVRQPAARSLQWTSRDVQVQYVQGIVQFVSK